MKKLLTGVAIAVALAGACAEDATESELEVSLSADFLSAYVWRGVTLNEDPVAQPYLDVAKGPFSLNVWANLDLGDNDGALESGEFSEVDLTLTYAFEAGPVEVTLNYIEYLYPHQSETTEEGHLRGPLPGTREVYARADMALVGNLATTFMYFYDFDEIKSYYASLGLTYGMELPCACRLEAGATAGYAGENAAESFGGTDAGWNDYALSIRISRAITEALEVRAIGAYTDTLDDDVLPDPDVHWYGGVGLTWTL